MRLDVDGQGCVSAQPLSVASGKPTLTMPRPQAFFGVVYYNFRTFRAVPQLASLGDVRQRVMNRIG